jgi:hypothetical protein
MLRNEFSNCDRGRPLKSILFETNYVKNNLNILFNKKEKKFHILDLKEYNPNHLEGHHGHGFLDL